MTKSLLLENRLAPSRLFHHSYPHATKPSRATSSSPCDARGEGGRMTRYLAEAKRGNPLL